MIITAKNRDSKSTFLWKSGTLHLTLTSDMRMSTDYPLHLAHLQYPLSQGQITKIGVAQTPMEVLRFAAHLLLEEWHMRHDQHPAHSGISLKPLKPFTELVT